MGREGRRKRDWLRFGGIGIALIGLGGIEDWMRKTGYGPGIFVKGRGSKGSPREVPEICDYLWSAAQ